MTLAQAENLPDIYPRGVVPFASYYLLEPLSAVYIGIPKNASSEIRRWLLRAINLPGIDPASRRALSHFDEALSFYARRITDRRSLLASSFVFTFLRDPILRIVSAFSNKFLQPGGINIAKPVIEAVAASRGIDIAHDSEIEVWSDSTGKFKTPASSRVDYSRGITFRQFVHYLCDTPDHRLDVHWRPQARFLDDVRLDFVGDVSSLARDLPRLAEHLGVDVPPPTQKPQISRDAPSLEPLADVPSGELISRSLRPGAAALVSREIGDLLQHRYAQDIALINQYLTAADCSALSRSNR